MLKRAYRAMMALSAAFTLGGAVFLWLVPVAQMERGYPAVGGEWVAVVFAAYVGFFLGGKVADLLLWYLGR